MSSQSSYGAPSGEAMDRSMGTDYMRAKMEACESMEIKQYRRGCLQECFCCVTKSDFKYYDGEKKIAESKEEFSFVCRCCFAPCHPFDMSISDPTSEHGDILEVNRPFRCCMGNIKPCCRQEATVFSGDDHLGDIQETCWCFVPQFKVFDHNEEALYIIRPPTCCGNMCMDCRPEGKNPCPHGCCMIPCDVYRIVGGAEAMEPV